MDAHTPGPWRWEFNASSKTVQLCGGRPKFDLMIMDFTRFGMNGAAPRFVERPGPGHEIMERCEKFAEVVPGREHHARWFKTVNHPDARLMAAAPDLFDLVLQYRNDLNHPPTADSRERRLAAIDAAIAKVTG